MILALSIRRFTANQGIIRSSKPLAEDIAIVDARGTSAAPDTDPAASGPSGAWQAT
jgi:hypothetical protein